MIMDLISNKLHRIGVLFYSVPMGLNKYVFIIL